MRVWVCLSVCECVCVCKQLCVIGNRKWKRPSLERGCRPCRATFSTFSTRNELKIDLLLQRRSSTGARRSSSNSSKSRRSTLRTATAAVTGAALGVWQRKRCSIKLMPLTKALRLNRAEPWKRSKPSLALPHLPLPRLFASRFVLFSLGAHKALKWFQVGLATPREIRYVYGNPSPISSTRCLPRRCYST